MWLAEAAVREVSRAVVEVWVWATGAGVVCVGIVGVVTVGGVVLWLVLVDGW